MKDQLKNALSFVVVLFVMLFLAYGFFLSMPKQNSHPIRDVDLRGITEDFPPYNFRDASGNIVGQSTDLVLGLAKRINQTISLELMDFSDGYNIVLAESNTFFYSLGRTPQREDLFKWVGPIGSWEITFYSLQNSTQSVVRLEDAKTAGKICVVKDDVRHQLLQENNFTNLLVVPEDSACAKKLAAGEVDLWLGSSTSFSGIVDGANLSIELFKAVYAVQKNDLYIAFNKDTPDAIVAQWQNALDEMEK